MLRQLARPVRASRRTVFAHSEKTVYIPDKRKFYFQKI